MSPFAFTSQARWADIDVDELQLSMGRDAVHDSHAGSQIRDLS